MIRSSIFALVVASASVAHAADLRRASPTDYGYPPVGLQAQAPLPFDGEAVPRFYAEPEPLGIIMLGAFWSEVRKSASVNEIAERVRGRFGPLPLVFTGTATNAGIPIRVVVTQIYRTDEDALIDLPAATIDMTVSLEGRPTQSRRLKIPLYPQTASAYR